MSGPALERVFRAASGRIIAVLAARYRNLVIAEDAFSEACVRALIDWPVNGVPNDAAAWLYRTASHIVLDSLRGQQVRDSFRDGEQIADPSLEERMEDDCLSMPDERLRLIFICCHPAVAQDARAALTLKLVCGLTTTEIARAFLVSETALARRLVRAKRKISDAGVPFELPPPRLWTERLEAVLSTLEIAYARAHEDASGTGHHASFSNEVLHLTRMMTELLPAEPEVHAIAALVRYAEARRPARIDADGYMVPLSEQDPGKWDITCIEEADSHLAIAQSLDPRRSRVQQAELQRIWCARRPGEAPPWRDILLAYDKLLSLRDDAVIRINRAVAMAEVTGPIEALREIEQLAGAGVEDYIPYHAVHADLLARTGRSADAARAYQRVLALEPGPAEARWIRRRLAALPAPAE